jgi:hypothetical protein
MQLLTVAISSKNFGGATPRPQIPTVCCLVYPPVPPTFLLPLSTLPLLFHASILITSNKLHVHYAKALLLRSVVARRRFTVRSDCCCFFICICRRLKQFVAFCYRKQQISLHMDTEFYRLYTDIDISQAKNLLQSANISEGALGFSGGTASFCPPPWPRAWMSPYAF